MNRWHWTDLLLTLILALVFGVLYWAWGFVWDAMAFSNTLAPGLRDLFYGFWLSAAIVAAAILRRPGAATVTQTLAAVVEMALNSQWSAYLLVAALAQGGLIELLFAFTRYKRGRSLLVFTAQGELVVGARHTGGEATMLDHAQPSAV